MKLKRTSLITLLLILAGVLSACTGAAFGATGWPGLAMDDDTAYVSYNQSVYAVNLDNGVMKWRYPEKVEGNKTFYANPGLAEDGQLIAGSYNQILYSLDPDSGRELWAFEQASDRYIGSPLVTQSMIYAPNADGSLYALDLNGNLVWTFKARGPLWAQPTTDSGCECLYVASMDHNIYALDAHSGDLIWQKNLGSSMVGTPALSEEGVLYIGTFGKEMAALEAANGDILWKTTLEDWVWAGPALHEGFLYFGDLMGNIYAINAEDGSISWRIQPDGPITATPSMVNGSLYFTTEVGSLFILDLNGKIIGNHTIGGKLYAPALANGDKVLVTPIGIDPLLVALNQDGTQLWPFTPPK